MKSRREQTLVLYEFVIENGGLLEIKDWILLFSFTQWTFSVYVYVLI